MKIKRLAALVSAAAITAGGVLLATPAQAGVPRPQPIPVDRPNPVTRTVNLAAGEGCEFPVRIVVRIRDLDRFRNANGRLVVDADGVRGKVINLRNGDTFRFSGDTRYRINLANGRIRGDGDQLLRLNRSLRSAPVAYTARHAVPTPTRRAVNRLVFTEDPTRSDLLGGRVPVLPRVRLLDRGDLVNVCAEIRSTRPRPVLSTR